MTWKGSEREVCWAWCVCALLCCVASGSTEDRGTGGVGSEGQKSTRPGQKSTLYTGKYKNLSPLNAANTRGKYQKSTLYTGKYKKLSPLNAANTRGKYQKPEKGF